MELSDEQKLVISTLCIQKQLKVEVSMYDRVQMVKDYAKSLNVQFPIDIYERITSEELNFITMLQTQPTGLIMFNSTASPFDNKTKYCIYSVEMILLQGDIPPPQALELEKAFRKFCIIDIKEQDEILEAIVNHLDKTLEYIGYWLENKKSDKDLNKSFDT